LFETGPFLRCPRCNNAGLGILTVGGNELTRRCRRCGHSHVELLPEVNKKVVYLDQFAVSELYKTKTNTRRPGAPHEQFWKECQHLANRAYLYQQVIFPASNVHSDETIVWHSPADLRLAHEMLSGETAFASTNDIASDHEQLFARAYLMKQEPPEIGFHVDDIIEGERNKWIPKFHIDVRADFSMFAPGIRADRASAEESLNRLAERWAKDKPTFDEVLRHELASYGPATKAAIMHAIAEFDKVVKSSDPASILDLRTGQIDRLRSLQFLFEKHGVPASRAASEVFKFFDWPGNVQQPIHRTSAYLFAALAWRISSGQRSAIKASILNDFNAVATYAPYIDAMFVDRQCASLLTQGRLRSELEFRAKIFSLSSADNFLQYLKDICDATPPDVRACAEQVYGVT
jgi:hypothetical protein